MLGCNFCLWAASSHSLSIVSMMPIVLRADDARVWLPGTCAIPGLHAHAFPLFVGLCVGAFWSGRGRHGEAKAADICRDVNLTCHVALISLMAT